MSGDLFLLPSSLNPLCPCVHSFDCIIQEDALQSFILFRPLQSTFLQMENFENVWWYFQGFEVGKSIHIFFYTIWFR